MSNVINKQVNKECSVNAVIVPGNIDPKYDFLRILIPNTIY